MRQDVILVMFSGVDWNLPPARQQYLAKALSRYCRVVFLDGGRDGRFRITHFNPSAGVTVVRGLACLLTALDRRRAGRMAYLVARRALARFAHNGQRVVYWGMENSARLDRFIQHDLLVYDCIDPCFSSLESELQEFDRREQQLLREADVVFATADALAEKCRQSRVEVLLLNNACAPEDYTPELVAAAPRPAWWPSSGQPVAAYLGSLDWRFDFEAARAAALGNQEVEFIFAGRKLQFNRPAIEQLDALPNVTCPGSLSVEEGRYVAGHCDVGLIPFTPGAMNDCINPVKMYMYALLGKPVVGTAVRELTARPDIAITGDGPEGFAAAVKEGLSRKQDPAYVGHLQEWARSNTWDHRAETAWEVLQQHLAGSQK